MSQQYKAYQDLLRHAIGLCMAIYELVTGHAPPAWRELLK